jgi:hypothetical protein
LLELLLLLLSEEELLLLLLSEEELLLLLLSEEELLLVDPPGLLLPAFRPPLCSFLPPAPLLRRRCCCFSFLCRRSSLRLRLRRRRSFSSLAAVSASLCLR